MKINFDRICRLAGVESGSERKKRLTEGTGHDMYHEEDKATDNMEEYSEAIYEEDGEGEGDEEDEEKHEMMDRLDEVVEIDPKVLMEEIRRAKKIKAIKENRRQQSTRKKESLQESHLKRVIRAEIQNILNEIDESENADSTWLYGNKKPKHSKKGYTNQGRLIPGIGFGKNQ